MKSDMPYSIEVEQTDLNHRITERERHALAQTLLELAGMVARGDMSTMPLWSSKVTHEWDKDENVEQMISQITTIELRWE